MASEHDLLADLTSGDELRAEAAAGLLAKRGAAVYPALESLLESADPDQRWWAVRTLAGMAEPRRDWLERAVGDVSAAVRAAAALALTAHPHEPATAALIQGLNDNDGQVAHLSMRALAAIGGAAVPQLIEAFEGAGQRARINILRALAEIRDPRAIGLMMKAMNENSAVLHYWAQVGLDALGLNMVYLMPD
jgi:HEAT repeat protein